MCEKERRGMRQGGWRGETGGGFEGGRRKDKAVKQRRGAGREGGRAEDTAAMKPVICQISHGRARIHIMSLNRERTMSNKVRGDGSHRTSTNSCQTSTSHGMKSFISRQVILSSDRKTQIRQAELTH